MSHENWLCLAKRFQRRSLKMVDGCTPKHEYTISSPCEPNGSIELKRGDGEILVRNYPVKSMTANQRWGQLLLKVIITITITLQFLHYHYHYTLFGNVIITITITCNVIHYHYTLLLATHTSTGLAVTR